MAAHHDSDYDRLLSYFRVVSRRTASRPRSEQASYSVHPYVLANTGWLRAGGGHVIPDICIFFDGVNDANQGIVNGNPWGTIRETERVYSSTGLFSALKRIAAVSVAARTVYHSIVNTQRRNIAAPRSPAEVGEMAHAVAEVYERNMLRANEICDRYHIRMIVFLQPHLFSIGRTLTADEKATAAGIRKREAQALRACYPLLREKLDKLRQRGILAYDISDAFDGNLEPIFVDDYHVESTGNGLIADAILKQALPVLSDSSQEDAPPVKSHGRTERWRESASGLPPAASSSRGAP